MHGFSWGACVVLFGGGHAWFYLGVCGFIWAACVVLFGGACVVLFGGHVWFYLGGLAWFYLGGHAWFYSGGHAWFFGGDVCGFFSFFRYNEIRSMSGRYASYWNAFLFLKKVSMMNQNMTNEFFSVKVEEFAGIG